MPDQETDVAAKPFPELSAEERDRLIRQLGSYRDKVRYEAVRKVKSLGSESLPLLLQGVQQEQQRQKWRWGSHKAIQFILLMLAFACWLSRPEEMWGVLFFGIQMGYDMLFGWLFSSPSLRHRHLLQLLTEQESLSCIGALIDSPESERYLVRDALTILLPAFALRRRRC